MQFLKTSINLLIVLILFIILCTSYILIIPAFEAPDENYHLLYSFYISKYNKVYERYNEDISAAKYVEPFLNKDKDTGFYTEIKRFELN